MRSSGSELAPTSTDSDAVHALIDARLDRLFEELRRVREILEGRHKPLLTVAEFAELVGRDEYTVRRWVKEKRIAATRIQGTGPKGRLLIARDEIDRIIHAGLGAAVSDSFSFPQRS